MPDSPVNDDVSAEAVPEGAYDDWAVMTYDFHHSMLEDRARVSAFHEAIVRTVNAGDVVLDVGTGTGVLALFAARAGARHVYAVEHGPVAEVAARIITDNAMGHRVTIVPGLSTQIELPERADVLVTETIGNAGFDEGITNWITDAKRRLLKPDARIIPEGLALEVALLDVGRDYAILDRWSDPLLRFDFGALRQVGINNLQPADIVPQQLVSRPARVLDISFQHEAGELAAEGTLTATRDSTAHALGVWFDAELGGGVALTNRPPSATPSWQQVLLPLPKPVAVEANRGVDFALAINGGGRDWRWEVAGSVAATVYGQLEARST